MTVPEAPWPVGPQNCNNARREGWKAYWEGTARSSCPFPKARNDLQLAFVDGWDTAKSVDVQDAPTEKLVEWRKDIVSWQQEQREYFPADILEIITEYAEWRDQKDVLIRNLAKRGHTTPGCDNWRAVSMCKQIEDLLNAE